MITKFLKKPALILTSASRPYLLSILSGILFGTSYIPFPPWAVFFSFVPLWSFWLKEKSLYKIFWTGWITQFVFTLIGFNWIAHTVHEFGHLPWPAAVVVLFLFCAVANLFIPLVGLLWVFICRRYPLSQSERVVLLVILTALGERTFPMIFDWNSGYTWFWAGFPAFHLADIVGFNGLSTMGLIFNGIFLYAWTLYQDGRSWKRVALSVPIFFLLLNLAGYAHGQKEIPTDRRLKVLMVQANIGNQEKLQAEKGSGYAATVINRFTALTQKGIQASGGYADFAIWPETAFPELIENPLMNTGYPAWLKASVLNSHTKLITGGYAKHESTGKLTNSFFILGENGEWLTKPYHKTVLLAFGEYFPFADWFPSLPSRFPEIADFSRGPGPSVLRAGDLLIGAQICYEGLFDWFARDQANLGAQVLINLTNDSWYGTWEQPFQHGYMTLARAVEVRRPMIRSTNTGISTVALASGEIMTLSPLHQEWFHLYDVPYAEAPRKTIFMGWGYWIFPSLFGLSLITLAIRSRKRL